MAMCIPLTVDDHAAIAVDDLPTHKRTVHRGKEHHTRRDLGWLPRPPHGAREILLRLIVHCRGD